MTPTERELQAALVVARKALRSIEIETNPNLEGGYCSYGALYQIAEQALSAISAVIPDHTAPNLREKRHDDT
jgi:hypothetical protein